VVNNAVDAIDAAVLQRLVTDESLGASARRIRDDIEAMPSPDSLVPTLEALAR